MRAHARANLSSINIHTFIHCFFCSSAIHLYLVCVRACVQAAAEEKPAWSVLRDDFMMGATMKDWDKESDTEEAAK